MRFSSTLSGDVYGNARGAAAVPRFSIQTAEIPTYEEHDRIGVRDSPDEMEPSTAALVRMPH
ncbi:MAG: hypothetical protein OXC62_12330 [Aestuariivita sp.]|nr:hypothetical protein [Aestuariivita sp.]